MLKHKQLTRRMLRKPAVRAEYKALAKAVALRKAGRAGKERRPRSRFATLRGTRKTGLSSDEIMNQLRGYDEDARDPGFKTRRK